VSESLLQLEPALAQQRFQELGGRGFHARIARAAVLERGLLDYAQIGSLPRSLRERLAAQLPILCSSEVARSSSPDRAIKLLLAFPSGRSERGPGTVETVFIPRRDPSDPRGATVCVSTQVGCPVACPFCASGKLGLERNLESHEILEQFVRARALGPISRAVVMGIGEPLLNLDSLTRALDVVLDEMGLGQRKITVSTVGFPERVRRLAERRPRFQLAISLHTPFDQQRDTLVPAMRGVPIEEVLAAGDHWFERTGRELTYEYVLLAGENDSQEHARSLAKRMAGRRATVNLIPFNPVEGSPFGRPTVQAVARFQGALESAGVVATVRWSRGVEAQAACGQLRLRSADAGAARIP
jgi:23S rRNA (adenine2503-C2)-methyltransferase